MKGNTSIPPYDADWLVPQSTEDWDTDSKRRRDTLLPLHTYTPPPLPPHTCTHMQMCWCCHHKFGIHCTLLLLVETLEVPQTSMLCQSGCCMLHSVTLCCIGLHCVTCCNITALHHLTKCWVLYVVLCYTMLLQEGEGGETTRKRVCVGAT